MMKTLVAPLVLQLVFFVVLILEFIIPSAGVLTALSIVALVASWWLVLASDVSWLFRTVLIGDLVLIPFILYYGFRLMQRSSMANHSQLSSADGYHTQVDLSTDWIGKTAVTHSMLKPWGKVEVDGEVFDATSTGPYVEPGIAVKIIAVHQNKLTVEII